MSTPQHKFLVAPPCPSAPTQELHTCFRPCKPQYLARPFACTPDPHREIQSDIRRYKPLRKQQHKNTSSDVCSRIDLSSRSGLTPRKPYRYFCYGRTSLQFAGF